MNICHHVVTPQMLLVTLERALSPTLETSSLLLVNLLTSEKIASQLFPDVVIIIVVKKLDDEDFCSRATDVK